MSAVSRYQPLSTDEPSAHVEEYELGKEHLMQDLTIAERRRGQRMIFWACIVALSCSLLNVLVLGLQSVAPRTLFSAKKPPKLEYASSYIGLETAIRDPTSPPLPPISNFPLVLAQVNASEPSTVLYDSHRWRSGFGMIYPEDRRFLLTPDVSTIAQFRAGDFGMERCSLTMSIPALQILKEEMNITAPSFFSNPLVFVDVWQADTGEIDRRQLSWSTRPTKQSLFASLELGFGISWESDEFFCRSGSYHSFTFDLSDGKVDTRVDFRQDPKKPQLGLLLVQRSSL